MTTQKSKKNITDAFRSYSEKRPIYEQLSKKIESIIQEILYDQKIHVYAIYSRTKDIDSLAKKIEDPKYSEPCTQITDYSGIRIITYVESDLDAISKLIESHFIIDPENSIDKSKSLGIDKVGYRSIHYIAKLPNDRIKLPEYKKFDGLFFEIQIRTILQHAWAEIEHDKNYKFSGELPQYLKSRFKVLAGVLELADREFDQIAVEIDKYIVKVNSDTKKGYLDIQIDSTSIKSFLIIKFANLIKKGMKPEFSNDEIERTELTELRKFGITTLKKLDDIIPNDFTERYIKYEKNQPGSLHNFSGLLRDLMLINDTNKYFKDCWNNSWSGVNKNTLELLKSYNKDIVIILEEFEIKIFEMN